jgi:glutathione S-transferase
MRPWLALCHAGADFVTETAEIELDKRSPKDPGDGAQGKTGDSLVRRRGLGSVTGLFPVLHVDDARIHESLAICEWANETFPGARLWPEDPLLRARARSISCEMLSGFANVRTHLSCHPFGRLRDPLRLDDATRAEVVRVFELWGEALERSGGPFLFGQFSIADCMYYPMRTRFRTYGVAIPDALAPYARALDAYPAVQALERVGHKAPRIEAYDEYLRSVGGDPNAA